MEEIDRLISIVIVNYNTCDMLIKCLDSLSQIRKNLKAKIIVVDNNSSDQSIEALKKYHPEVELIESKKNIGYGRGNNLCRPVVDSEYILFLNPDTVVLKDSIEKMLENMNEDSSIGITGCKMRNLDGKLQELGIQWFPSPMKEFLRILLMSENTFKKLKSILPIIDSGKSAYVKKLYGGCMLCRKAALDNIDWFDERFFMYAEDVDLSYRIIQKGWKLYYQSEAEIIHVGGGSTKKIYKQFSTLMKSQSIEQLIEKYYGKKGKIINRIGVFTASSLRLIAVYCIIVFFKFLKREVWLLSETKKKYETMVLWSLNLKKARIGK